MKQDTRILIRQFNLNKYDFMGYHLNKNQATFHHILKKENGGQRILENGAVLMPLSHEYLHLIEYKDFESYYLINEMFKYFHEKGKIDIEDYILIDEILTLFEKNFKNVKGSKGKLLIKNEYKNRIFKIH